MFFSDWFSLLRVVVVGVLAYAGLLLTLRISGKRTLSKMNAFDLIVTVALGSTLATVLLSKDVPLSEGITAFVLLIGLQYLITWLSVRSRRFEDLVKAEPSLLFFHGEFQMKMMRRQRITQSEVRAAAREQGISDIASVAAVVLETNGKLTVLTKHDGQNLSALQDVHLPDQPTSS